MPAWRDWARRRHSTHLVLKAVVLASGATLVVAGAAMLVLPGPGVAAILLGLVVLGSEFAAADRLRARLQDSARAGWSRATGRRHPRPARRPDLHADARPTSRMPEDLGAASRNG